MREYRINLTHWGIDRNRYDELKARCRQYPDKKMELDSLLCVSSPSMTGMPHGSGVSDPVVRAVSKRERLLRFCEPIEYAASRAAGGEYSKALILNCCFGKGYEFLPPAVLPTSNRNAFFCARREFFWLLDKRLESEEFDTPGAVKT